MNTKKERREAAQKRARTKKITVMTVCAVCFVAIAVFVAVYIVTRPDSRVFAVSGGQSITLYENGRFNARLFHNTNISGTFVEDGETISFTHGNNVVFSQIENDVLLLPTEWWGACRGHTHETEFPRVR
ncbi:MAG: hypothetical protein FWC70_04210 [Defluviitaleaceae bacterium]|nr:hypothetical protein [Defluviitaleaceae bacterium]